MRRFWVFIAAAPLMLGASTVQAGSSASFGAKLSAEVPIICKLVHRGATAPQQNGYFLGQIQEFCNSPTGYVVEIDYPQGTLRGTTLRVGDREILLDGSGHGEVARASGPKIRLVDVSATLPQAGYDAASLEFRITPL